MTENVYVKGKLFPSNTAVTIYLIPDGANAIPANAVANTTAIADSNGNLSTTIVWSSPLMQGSYDIWVDVNQHSAFDASDVWKRVE